MGTLFKKKGSRHWQMGVWIGGKQRCKSTHTSNKRLARQLLTRWETDVFEGRHQLVKSRPPRFDQWADEFLARVIHPNTRRRYASSIVHLKAHFPNARLSDINVERIDAFKENRISAGVGPATVNRDLAVLRLLFRIAEKKRFIARSPFTEVELLEERRFRKQPHILSFEDEERILTAAEPHIQMLVVLIRRPGCAPVERHSASNGMMLILPTSRYEFVSQRHWQEFEIFLSLPGASVNSSAGGNAWDRNSRHMSSPTCELLTDR